MRVDYPELEIAARRERAQAIAALIARAFAWLVSRGQQLTHAKVRHAARPHFAR